MMVPMTDRLVVEIGDCSACPGVQTARVHHPDRVDCHGEGATPHEAIACLLRRLIAERDSLFDTWHRAELEQVIAEVHAALDEDDATEQTANRAHGPRGLEPTTFEAALSNANGRARGMVRGSIDPGGRTGGLDAGSLGRLLVPAPATNCTWTSAAACAGESRSRTSRTAATSGSGPGAPPL